MSDQTNQAGDAIPSSIGRYKIIGTLGTGAMGAVYKAFDPLIKRTLAIKTIRLDVPRNSPHHRTFIDRFYQEARISGTLSHPSIVTLFDIGEEGGVPFLAMEFVDGRTIASCIEEGTRFKPERVVGLVSQIALALDYAHSRGVVHRDIKPSNLILFGEDKVKVTDFGIAKLADSDITHSGALVGTPSYMSPEQAMGEKLDGRSDIFSLGVCAFEMLSGIQPFPGANVTSILYKLVHVDPVEPIDLEANGLVPQKWREVFHKVLAKKPAERYQTASDFVRDLEYCLGAWFTGLGEETISFTPPTIAMSPSPVSAATIAPGDGDSPQTVLLSAAVPETAAEPEQTVMVNSASPTPRADEQTVQLHGGAAEPVPQTVLMAAVAPRPLPPPVREVRPRQSPPEASQTRPPEPVSAAGPRPVSRRRGLSLWWVAGGAAALSVLAAGVVGIALWRRAQTPEPPRQDARVATPAPAATTVPPPAAPVTPPPTTGSLRVESEPEGARVRVDGEVKGRTPLVVAGLPPGEYELRIEQNGYEPQSRRVSLGSADPVAEVHARLVRTAPLAGIAEVVSSPPGAAVMVDGRPVGRTPVLLPGVRPGSRTLDLVLEGHQPWSGTLKVVAGQRGRVEVTLQPLAQPRPRPTTEPVDTARVYQDNEVDVKPRKLSGSSPSYPDKAPRLRSGERISVLVRFVVTESGEVRDVSVVESGGKAVDDVVVSAVRGWRYEPATKRGTKVKAQTVFKQTFLGG